MKIENHIAPLPKYAGKGDAAQWDWGSAAKVVEIPVQAGGDNGLGFFVVFDFPDFRGLGVFQLLVDGEEMLHLVENMPGQLVDVVIAVVSGVVKGDSNNFFILAAPIVHDDHTNGIASHQ